MEYCNIEYKIIQDDGSIIFKDRNKILDKNKIIRIYGEKISKTFVLYDNATRYVHKVKLKNPLKIIIFNDRKHDEIDYLGSIIDYGIDIRIEFNTNEIISDEIIFDLSRYNTHLDETVTLTEEQQKKLKEYTDEVLPEDELAIVSRNLIETFKYPIRELGNKEYILYRGLNWDSTEYTNFKNFVETCPLNNLSRTEYVSSWTSNLCVASSFAYGGFGVVLWNKFKSEDILIDTRIIKNIDSIHEEIIIKPGVYSCNIYCQMIQGTMYYPNAEKISIIELK